MADLRLQVILTALDKVTAPLKKIRDAAAPTARALKATSDRLKELNAQQKSIDKFRELNVGLTTTAQKLKSAQSNAKRLAKELQLTATPSRALSREFKAATTSARALKTEHAHQSVQLQVLRTSLSNAGISTKELGRAQLALKQNIGLSTVQLKNQQAQLSATTATQHRLATAKQGRDKLRGVAGNMAMAGAGAMVAGRVMSAPVMNGIGEAKHWQLEEGRIRALGLPEADASTAIKFAKELKTYGTSQLENLELMRDAITVFADTHEAQMVTPLLAKMKFGNKAFYGEEQGADNERKFMDMLKVIELRGGLQSRDAFTNQANIVQQVITATGGRVGPAEWLNLIKTGGVAAKGLGDKAFYYQMEPLVQEMGGFRTGTGMMSAYSNLYQGRTTKRAARNLEQLGLIGDDSKVSHDKAGQLSFLNPGALLGSDLFRANQFEWLEQVLLPQLAKKGITEKDAIIDTIGSLFSNRTASNLFSQMFLQRDQIHKNAKLNESADNIDQLDIKGQGLITGKESAATASLGDLMLAMGEQLAPLYAEGIVMLTNALKSLNKFIKDNPALSRAMLVGLGGIATVLVVIGPLMLGLAALIGPYTLLSFIFTKLGATGGMVAPIIRSIGTAFVWLSRAIAVAGSGMLANPIGLIVLAIAVSAFLIYKYWQPIKAWLSGFFAGLMAGLAPLMPLFKSVFSFMGTLFAPLKPVWDWIVEKLKLAWTWFKELISPVKMTQKELDGVTGSGHLFGKWLGGIIIKLVDFGIALYKGFIKAIGNVATFLADWSPIGLFYRALAPVLQYFGVDIPDKFSDFGINLIASFIKGIRAQFPYLEAVFSKLEGIIPKAKLSQPQIQSTQQTVQFAHDAMDNLGLPRRNNTAYGQADGVERALLQGGSASAAFSTPFAAAPLPAFNFNQSPVRAAKSASVVVQGDNNYFTINPSQGMDETAVAREVTRELDKRKAISNARQRSQLADY